MRRNSGSVTFSGRCSATFVTRLRTERMPLVWIFVGSTRSASLATERSESNMIVPWCITRPWRMYCELPENFFPSIVMSLRPLTSAFTPSVASVRTTGSQKSLRSSALLSPTSVMNVKFRLPMS